MDRERELKDLQLQREAELMLLQGRMHGSLTFRIMVVNRDWEGVKHEAPHQRDVMHGVPTLTVEDWRYLREEAAKDGFLL